MDDPSAPICASALARVLSIQEVRGLLRARVDEAGTQRLFARQHGLSEPDLSRALRGPRSPTASILRAVGVEHGFVQR